ncbi:hypothetical protein AALP_AA6G308000 [Arabis alpina]|uniref:Uncharacterized protein n=1 Tax=Arabis alpina TaxID=50452 RepID=A0A087GST0_ARAAL|nr:hypothetical protein AALP_AA6G308000 [Arabis alpina]
MSKMRSFLKPPLPKSPLRLRSRQVLHENSISLLTPPGSVTKPARRRLSDANLQPKLPFDYSTISNEIHALAKMVKDEFSEEEARKKSMNLETLAAKSVPVFERGRFYEEYSAKRNERLRRKKGGEEGMPYNLGVNREPMTNKRRGGGATTAKKIESFKKSVSMVETTTMMPRYSLRSMTKENKKPPMIPLNVTVSAMKCVSTTRRGRRI